LGAEADFDRARALAGTGRTSEAMAVVERVLIADPRHRGARLLKASLLTEDRDFEGALALLEETARLWPRSAEALNAFARCLHGVGRDDEALAQAGEARRFLGEDDNFVHTAAVYLTLVWCLREKRRYREAIALAEEGLARTPDAILAHWATQLEDELVEAEKERC
jgi:tetratricopeptide (TPR) repeat protein